MGYKLQPKVRIDLGELGDNQGTPFFVEIRNPRMLTFEQKIELSKIAEAKDTDEQKQVMNDTAKRFIVAWNLLDFETDEPVSPNQPDALQRVPSEVVESIFKAFQRTSDEDDESKNLSPQSDNS